MIKITKLALLAGMVGFVTSAEAAAYNNDLMIGFTDGVGNDVVYDLGSPTVVLTNGASWNLAAATASFTLSTVNWGVVGNNSGATSSRLLYTTSDAAPVTAGAARGNSVNTADTALYSGFTTAGAGKQFTIAPTEDNSWNRQTLNPTLPTQYLNAWENPNTVGTTSFKMWRVQANSSAPVQLGTFSLAANGVLSFATNSAVVGAPPAPQIVSMTRVGNTSTVFFTTTNGVFTYNLYYTNDAAGLKSPISTWAVSATAVTGNGLTNSIPDTSTDLIRFYRVGVH